MKYLDNSCFTLINFYCLVFMLFFGNYMCMNENYLTLSFGLAIL